MTRPHRATGGQPARTLTKSGILTAKRDALLACAELLVQGAITVPELATAAREYAIAKVGQAHAEQYRGHTIRQIGGHWYVWAPGQSTDIAYGEPRTSLESARAWVRREIGKDREESAEAFEEDPIAVLEASAGRMRR